MGNGRLLVVRPTRAGYLTAGIFLFLGLILLAIGLSMRAIRGVEDAILAVVVVGGLTLLGINEFLSAAVPRITVDDATVDVRNRLGRHRRLTRAEIGLAAHVSLFAPLPYAPVRAMAFLLVGKDGRCLARVAQSDYRNEDLDRLVTTLGLAEPHSHKLSVRQMNRKFPGAYALDFQTAVIVIVAILALALAVAAIAVSCG